MCEYVCACVVLTLLSVCNRKSCWSWVQVSWKKKQTFKHQWRWFSVWAEQNLRSQVKVQRSKVLETLGKIWWQIWRSETFLWKLLFYCESDSTTAVHHLHHLWCHWYVLFSCGWCDWSVWWKSPVSGVTWRLGWKPQKHVTDLIPDLLPNGCAVSLLWSGHSDWFKPSV